MYHTSTLAVFDFDGTLTYRDSLIPLLIFKEGRIRAYWKLAKLLPSFLLFELGKLSRQKTKEKILTSFFWGMAVGELEDLALDYAENALDQQLKPEAMEKLRWHLDQGHRCVVISASLEVYLKPWAKRHGIDEVLASRLEIVEAHVSGKLAGLNCWGPEKVRRLLEYAGNKNEYILYAYGDSHGDRELLSLADHPFYKSF
jgi:HAD superfamily hydrolase (TIGR01490 family)